MCLKGQNWPYYPKGDGGIDDGKGAWAYAAEKHVFIDLKRVYAVGHSSAGTLSLAIAQQNGLDESMKEEGIPAAMEWLLKLGKEESSEK